MVAKILITNHPRPEQNDLQPDWSPNGSKLAIVSTRDTPPGGLLVANVYVINADGSDQQRLTTSDLSEGLLDW